MSLWAEIHSRIVYTQRVRIIYPLSLGRDSASHSLIRDNHILSGQANHQDLYVNLHNRIVRPVTIADCDLSYYL